MSALLDSLTEEAREPELRARIVKSLETCTAQIARGEGLLLELYEIQSALSLALREPGKRQ
jgi:hypothetical protein